MSLREALARTFDLATLRHQARHLRKPEHWHKAQAITERARKARAKEIVSYRNQYESRVEVARRRLIEEAAARRRDFIPAFAFRDRFSKEDTLRQARRDVQRAHLKVMAKIDLVECAELDALVQKAKHENTLQHKTRNAFARTSERYTTESRAHQKRFSRTQEP